MYPAIYLWVDPLSLYCIFPIDWLTSSSEIKGDGTDMAYCKVCDCKLRPHLARPKLHATRNKHVENIKRMKLAAVTKPIDSHFKPGPSKPTGIELKVAEAAPCGARRRAQFALDSKPLGSTLGKHVSGIKRWYRSDVGTHEMHSFSVKGRRAYFTGDVARRHRRADVLTDSGRKH
ncbi:hypothetical protein HPB48_019515 [Haemaphysalis longicornis]|uniref:Uncharacterized protein n=1 Tax=Haemaphysalis longicornis TaxID=44386 RepID=A0A9J6FNM4_HAELO|nr:hypothetical protein HPB48_019515 [Haemaphysalis longicornis]